MGRRTIETGPERRCIVGGASGDTASLIRFVLGPDGGVVPDIDEKLPGRGAWLSCDAASFEKVAKKNPFPRAFKSPARVPDGLYETVDHLLAHRCRNLLGLANSAGQVVAGYEKVREMSDRGPVGVMIVAADGGDSAQSRARKMAWDAPLITHIGRDDLSLALGRENVVHAAVAPGQLAEKFVRDTERLRQLRGFPDARVMEKRTVDD